MNNLLHRLGRTTALIVASGFVAHAAGDGTLAATVLDITGKPVAGASVVISSPTQIGGARTYMTDGSGKARFPRLTPGKFKVVITATGYQTQTLNDIEVTVDQTANVNLKLVPVGGAVVEVVSSVPTVDVTTVTAGTQVTQEELSQLPLGRTQLSTLILSPGVIMIGGDPTLAAGLGRDNRGNLGSRNNSYLIDGVDVTSPEAGQGRTNLPQEIISVQDVKTGAITAEYSARAGLFSNATTIPGGNEFHGGVNFYTTTPNMKNLPARGTSQQPGTTLKDSTAFMSGPIIKDKLWFVASYQNVKETGNTTVNASSAFALGERRGAVLQDEQRTFAKLTWQIAPEHLVFASFMKNPGKFDNLSDPNQVTSRGLQTVRGGDNLNIAYTWQSPSLIFDFRFGSHKESNTQKALSTALGPQLNEFFPVTAVGGGPAPAIPLNQRTFGNSSAGDARDYERQVVRGDLTWMFELAGSHTMKFGLQQGTDKLTQLLSVSQGVSYETLAPRTNGVAPTMANLGADGYGGAVVTNSARLLTALNAPGNPYPSARAAVDTNANGVVDLAELDAYQFNELFDPARPNLGYYGQQFIQVNAASSSPKMEYNGFYVQDQWQIGRFNFSPGFRMDKYKYVADNGTELFKTNYNFAPRVGLTYDVFGDGKSKAYAYWGRYIDPIKLDMVRFTGSLTSSERDEQLRVGGQWVNVNVRGGTKVVDAVFANNFKLPKTEEYRLGFSHDFGNSWAIDAVYTHRRDYDIVEDWDPTLYTDADALEAEGRSRFGGASTPAFIVAAFRALALPTEYFAGGGYTGAQNTARVAGGTLNFVLANLPGGERVFDTYDVSITRKLKDNWGGFWTFSKIKAKGNSVSSGDADFQGDLSRWDPRLPYTNGHLDGSLDWQTKGYAYMKWDNGFLVGLTATFTSGYHYSRSTSASNRILLSVPANSSAEYFNSEQQGTRTTPTTQKYDARFQYSFDITKMVKADVYLDVNNLTNQQGPTNLNEGSNLSGAFAQLRTAVADEPYAWQAPRTYFLGVKVKF